MRGYDFSFRPEQSVPFVIGKVEVSTAPFKYLPKNRIAGRSQSEYAFPIYGSNQERVI
jgi:hypothetical protein